LYRRLKRSLRPQGRLVIVDCQPAAQRELFRAQREAWIGHLRRTYSAEKAARLLASWGLEDVYVPLEAELRLLEGAGFRVDVLWRKGAFAVLIGR
jgi:hypothetical protein